MIASPETLRALEWGALVALVADEARTDLGARRLLEVLPATERAELVARRRAHAEAARLAIEAPLVPSQEDPVAPLVERLGTARPPLEGVEIVQLARLLSAAADALGRIRSANPPCPELVGLAEGIEDPRPLVARVGRTLDRKGRVRDDASPRLRALSREIRASRDRLYDRLERLREGHRELFGDETVPLRGGRLLLVLSAGARGRLEGLVHGRSASGKSFYFEPLEVVEDNNQLQTAVEEQEAERRRLLDELRDELARELPLVESLAELVAMLDALEAAERWARDARARLPEIAPDGRLRLVGARHPLLEPALAARRERVLGSAGHRGETVPLDLELDRDRRILVVTGPNAGGKTVAAKTVGLAALMAQAGLPVPCDAGSELPLFASVVATVGDEQDLLAERSTFSGRLARLAEAWRQAGPGSLALLDELGSGTDPEEGSALAVALVEKLLDAGGLAVVTTHLAAVAAAALEQPGAGCAAMEFEPTSGRPTFRLRPGPPGGSEALALGRRLGLAPEWIDRAEELLGDEHRELRRSLAELERTREELARATAEAERKASELAASERRLERERSALEAERRTVGRRLEAELRGFREKVLAGLREKERELRTEFEKGRRRGVAAKAAERLFAESPQLDPEPEPESAGPLEVGARVRHRGLGWSGRLARLDEGRAEVTVGGKRVRCDPDQLVALAGDRPQPASPRTGRSRTEPEGAGAAIEAELMLLGFTVEDGLDAVDEYLDRALRAARTEVRIVHGHGTGRLREAVRKHLRSHPAVAEFRPGSVREGGNGATVVALRE